jgi:hypothetical protein
MRPGLRLGVLAPCASLSAAGLFAQPKDFSGFGLGVEGLGSTQDRVIDASAKKHSKLIEKLTLGFGYGLIEGGADVDSVFNLACLHFAAVSPGYHS